MTAVKIVATGKLSEADSSRLAMVDIETVRLRLVPWRHEDVAALHALWSEPHVRKFLFDDIVIGREQAMEIISTAIESSQSAGFTQWSIRLRETPDLIIGFAGLRGMDDACQQPELLYGLTARHWRQGLATEASHAVLQDGFTRLGLPAIWASADAPNVASLRVMQRLGMKQTECVSASAGLLSYRILREEFQPLL